ncbi:hypothetical protein TRVA0_003S02696 [Trichomonascus vanleenenianus]|uniref:uncharacterized protein n=1 Tax=Trichomonascus vanleenenianus TaxID=2268995 RepID=UPI003ECB6EB7
MTIDYRGATVEDLDLLPALSIHPNTLLSEALDMSYERSYSYLPVISSKDKRLLGYLTAEQLQKEANADPKSKVKDYYVRFQKQAKTGREFTQITPNTPLEQLEEFFASGEQFAIVTDEQNRFVLGVATKDDLDKYVKSRPSLS